MAQGEPKLSETQMQRIQEYATRAKTGAPQVWEEKNVDLQTDPEENPENVDIPDDLPKKFFPLQAVRRLAARLRFGGGAQAEHSGTKTEGYVNPNLITEYSNISAEEMQKYLDTTADVLLNIPERQREEIVRILFNTATGGSTALMGLNDPSLKNFNKNFQEFLKFADLEGRVVYQYKKDEKPDTYDVAQQRGKKWIVSKSNEKPAQDLINERAKRYAKRIPQYGENKAENTELTQEMLEAVQAAYNNMDYSQPGLNMEGARPGEDAITYGFNMAREDSPEAPYMYANELPAFKKLITDMVDVMDSEKENRIEYVQSKLEQVFAKVDPKVGDVFVPAFQNFLLTGSVELNKNQSRELAPIFFDVMRILANTTGEKKRVEDLMTVYHQGEQRLKQDKNKAYVILRNPSIGPKFQEYFAPALTRLTSPAQV